MVVDEPVRGSLPDPSFGSLAGIDRARAWLRSVVPPGPVHHLIGVRLTQVGSGSAVGTMPASPWMQTFDGTIDFRILLETGLTTAVLTGAPPGTDVRPAAIMFNNLRPTMLEAETLVARAHVLNSGRTFTLAEVLLEDRSGRGLAHGVGTYVMYSIDPPPPPWNGHNVPVDPPVYASPDPYLRPLDERTAVPTFDDMPLMAAVRAIIDGTAPAFPIQNLLGMYIRDLSEGSSAISLRTSDWLCLRDREVTPGAVASLAHHVLGGATGSLCAEAGWRIGILDQTVTFLAPVVPDGRELLARSHVTHRRGEYIVCSAEITDADGQIVAVGHQTSMLLPPRKRLSQGASIRRVITVLFSDIVKSTERAAELGDARWTELLDRHDATVRKHLQLFKGTEVKTTGDGFLATFESPGQAVQAARAMRDSLQSLGVEIRIGLHTGECEVSKTDVAGIAVHIASRIQAMAEPGDILLSGTVHDLVTGSGLPFTDRGRHPLKGVQGEWQIYALADSSHS